MIGVGRRGCLALISMIGVGRRGCLALISMIGVGRRGCPAFIYAILSATDSASFSMASPGFETVSGPLVGAPRCWTTCASSCAISLSPSVVLGLYWSWAK